jgi:hypothetical protein
MNLAQLLLAALLPGNFSMARVVVSHSAAAVSR